MFRLRSATHEGIARMPACVLYILHKNLKLKMFRECSASVCAVGAFSV